MSEMVERVARVLYERWRIAEGSETSWEMANERCKKDGYMNAKRITRLAREDARAAINAMREPLPEMIGAFWRQKNCGTQEIGKTGSETHDYAAWSAAIDAALSDND